jgi:hypothetical protein
MRRCAEPFLASQPRVPRLADSDTRGGRVEADADPPCHVFQRRQRRATLEAGDRVAHVADFPLRGVVGCEGKQFPGVLSGFLASVLVA